MNRTALILTSALVSSLCFSAPRIAVAGVDVYHVTLQQHVKGITSNDELRQKAAEYVGQLAAELENLAGKVNVKLAAAPQLAGSFKAMHTRFTAYIADYSDFCEEAGWWDLETGDRSNGPGAEFTRLAVKAELYSKQMRCYQRVIDGNEPDDASLFRTRRNDEQHAAAVTTFNPVAALACK